EDPGVIATQSTHKQLAGFSQASQIHVRDAPYPREAVPDEPQAVQRDVHAAGIDVPVLSAVLQPRRQCADACRQGRPGAVGRYGEARYRGAQGGAPPVRRFPRSVRARHGRVSRQADEMGGCPDGGPGAGAGLLAADARRQVARLSQPRRRCGHGRPDEVHADHARHRHPHRQLREERHSRDDPRQLPPGEQRDPGEERSEQHPLPDDAGGG
ncbi:MAG: hypothetical protein HC869_12795, partial [Rhodospirillales bacterium]|nr:hypothetical protein [Rhodospirillales bacterium]